LYAPSSLVWLDYNSLEKQRPKLELKEENKIKINDHVTALVMDIPYVGTIWLGVSFYSSTDFKGYIHVNLTQNRNSSHLELSCNLWVQNARKGVGLPALYDGFTEGPGVGSGAGVGATTGSS